MPRIDCTELHKTLTALALEIGADPKVKNLDDVVAVMQRDVSEHISRDTLAESIYNATTGHARARDELAAKLDALKREGRSDVVLRKAATALQEHIKAGTLPTTKPKPGAPPEPVAGLQSAVKDLRSALAKSDPAIRAKFEKQIDALTTKLDTNDFAPPDKPERLPLSKDLALLEYKRDLLAQRVRGAIRNLKPRTTGEKIRDMISWWARERVLSSPVSFVKLASAAAEGLTIEPAQEAIGAGINRLAPAFAARLEAESSSSIKIEAAALTRAFTRLIRDVGSQIAHGTTDYETKYGSKTPMPNEMVSYFGRMHAATKGVLKRAVFERVFAKLAVVYARRGANIDDPMVQMQIGTHALKEAERRLFLEDNIIVRAVQRATRSFAEPSETTGKPTKSGLVAGAVTKTLLPIVRIPTNIVSRTFEAALGLPVGAGRLGLAYAKGIEKLQPEHADAISRQLKAGSLGAAFLLYGFFNPSTVGGYYQPGEKRDPDDAQADSMKINGVNVPRTLLHHPLLQVMQLGATIRRVADSKLRKKDDVPQGLIKGVAAGAVGTLESAPMVRETFDVGKIRDPHQRDKFLTDYALGLVVPLGAKWVYRKFYPPEPKPPAKGAKKHYDALLDSPGGL